MIRSPSGYAPIIPAEEALVPRKPRAPRPTAVGVAGVASRRKRKPRHRP